MQKMSSDPVRNPPAAKLLHASNASNTRIELLQNISKVNMPVMYNETIWDKMGIIP